MLIWNVEAIHHWFPVVPRPFACVCVGGGGGGGGSYNLFSHARDSQEKNLDMCGYFPYT